MRQSVDVLILGAGLSGLSVAYHLEDLSRLKTLVVEKETIPVLVTPEFNALNIQKGQKFRFVLEVDPKGVLITKKLSQL